MSIKNGATTIQAEENAAKEQTTINVNEAVTFSNVHLHTTFVGDHYYIGDAYDKTPLNISQEWEINTSKFPYLAHVKSISTAWPQLRYLSDFMEVSTIPLRWKFLRGNDTERRERSCRTKVTILDFPSSGKPTRKDITNADELETPLREKSSGRAARMIVVEDLSRQVIEILGATFDIDPAFFRQQINDYSWYNIRDRWMEPPNLKSTSRNQNWTRVRFVRPRYFRTNESFQSGREESNTFNVMRRLDDDQNQWTVLDGEAIVALMRTRSSLWVNTDYGEDHETIGIVLVDPTIKGGHTLWYGYQNWARTPSMYRSTSSPTSPPRTSLFEDVVYWATTYPWFSSSEVGDLTAIGQALTYPILYLACAEWGIMCEYIKARLGQIEWELGFPEQFHSSKEKDVISLSVRRLHTWRRLIALYRDMIFETINDSIPTLSRLTREKTGLSSDRDTSSGTRSPYDQITEGGLILDFEGVSRQMKDLQDRTDRLTSVLMAAISIQDSRRGLQENQNVARLTWLATVFIPLTFVAGLFSMQQDIQSLQHTFGWYFAAAVPITAVALAIATNINNLPLLPKGRSSQGRGQ